MSEAARSSIYMARSSEEAVHPRASGWAFFPTAPACGTTPSTFIYIYIYMRCAMGTCREARMSRDWGIAENGRCTSVSAAVDANLLVSAPLRHTAPALWMQRFGDVLCRPKERDVCSGAVKLPGDLPRRRPSSWMPHKRNC